MIYTSYFANASKLPNNICAISIAAKPPKGWKGPQYKILSPKYDILMDWKNDGDTSKYIERFNNEVLSNQNPEKTVKLLKQIAGNRDICLLCYEKPEDFCHRHLVAKWLTENGFECIEYT